MDIYDALMHAPQLAKAEVERDTLYQTSPALSQGTTERREP